MARVLAGMTVSLDGFIEDADGRSGGLYTDLDDLQDSDWMRSMQAETGSVLMGRRTFEMGGDFDAYVDGYEFQVPLYVVTHQPPADPPKGNGAVTFTFVPDLVDAVEQAKAAAGDLDVMVVGGADINRQLLRAGLADELRVDIVPVLLGSGVRLFEGLGAMAFEKIGLQDVGQRVSLRYRPVTPERSSS